MMMYHPEDVNEQWAEAYEELAAAADLWRTRQREEGNR